MGAKVFSLLHLNTKIGRGLSYTVCKQVNDGDSDSDVHDNDDNVSVWLIGEIFDWYGLLGKFFGYSGFPTRSRITEH